MTDVPFPISRAYNSAPPTGTRLSLGVPVCPPFSLAVEPVGAHAAYAHARIARTSVAFMAVKPITHLTANLVLIGTTPRVTGNSAVKPLDKRCRPSGSRLSQHRNLTCARFRRNPCAHVPKFRRSFFLTRQKCIEYTYTLHWMFLTIDTTDARPIYQQVADGIKELIARGKLEGGAALPPVRQLAADLGVNLNTIATAYRELEKDGLVVIKHGSGCEVAPRAATDRSHDELAQTLRTALTELVLAGLPTKRILKMVIRELQMVGKEGK